MGKMGINPGKLALLIKSIFVDAIVASRGKLLGVV